MIHLLLSMTLFLAPTDPALNEESNNICPCKILSKETQEVADQMLNAAFDHTQDRSKAIMVGLAAPQIGIQKRIILVDLAATDVFTENTEPPPPQIEVFINPEILWRSAEMAVWREGCYSTGHICGLVPRSKQVLVRAYDRKGNLSVHEYSGYTARIFQHEIDHLDGTRFPDRVENDAHLHWVEESEAPQYRIHWANWQKIFPREKWLEMKNGNLLLLKS